MRRIVAKLVIALLITAFISTGTFVPAARAIAIDTSTYLGVTTPNAQIELQSLLASEEVRQQLEELGVSADDAAKRIASLTPEELSYLQKNLEDLPAGSNALAILGAVLLVLIILEVLGVTNVFTRL